MPKYVGANGAVTDIDPKKYGKERLDRQLASGELTTEADAKKQAAADKKADAGDADEGDAE